MKRKYNKPVLAVESFQIDAAVAGGCSDQNKYPLNFQVGSCEAENDYFSINCDVDVFNEANGSSDPMVCYQAFAYEMYITS